MSAPHSHSLSRGTAILTASVINLTVGGWAVMVMAGMLG